MILMISNTKFIDSFNTRTCILQHIQTQFSIEIIRSNVGLSVDLQQTKNVYHKSAILTPTKLCVCVCLFGNIPHETNTETEVFCQTHFGNDFSFSAFPSPRFASMN